MHIYNCIIDNVIVFCALNIVYEMHLVSCYAHKSLYHRKTSSLYHVLSSLYWMQLMVGIS